MTRAKGFLKFGFIKKMISPTVAQVEDIGGEVQETIVSPKGLYSKPIEADAVSMPVMDGETQTAVMPIQDFIDFLENGDVILTDDKSYIHFRYEDGEIYIKADMKVKIEASEEIEMIAPKVTIKTDEFKVEATESISFEGATIKNNGVNTGDTHLHFVEMIEADSLAPH